MKVIKQGAHLVTDWDKMNLYERCEFAGRISHASEHKIEEGSAGEFVKRMVNMGHESVFEFARVMIKSEQLGYIYDSLSVRRMREILKEEKYDCREVEIARIISEEYPSFFSDAPSKFWELDVQKLKEKYWMVNTIYLESTKFSSKYCKAWIPVLITTNRAISHQLVRYRKDVVYLQASQRYIKFHDDVDFISPDVYFDMDDAMYRQWISSMEGAEQDYIHCLSQGYSAQAARLFLPNSTATKLIMYASPDTWRHVFDQRLSNKADPMIRELLSPLKGEFEKEGFL